MDFDSMINEAEEKAKEMKASKKKTSSRYTMRDFARDCVRDGVGFDEAFTQALKDNDLLPEGWTADEQVREVAAICRSLQYAFRDTKKDAAKASK